jgi:hypothetical protein
MAPLRLRIDGRTFRDADNRTVILHGINAAADAKFPLKPEVPSNVTEHFFDGDNVSFVGRPFSVDSANVHFARLKRWGYNTIRYVFTWEAIEAAGPGRYDEEWIKHTISVLRVAKRFGFYVFMDPHQDVVRKSSPICMRYCFSWMPVVEILRRIRSADVDIVCLRAEPARIRRH